MTTHPAAPAAEFPVEPLGHWLTQAPHDDPLGDRAVRPADLATRALTADGRAGSEARRFTGATLSGWNLGPLVDNAVLVVTELLSNALRYGLAKPAGQLLGAAPRPLWLGLLRCRDLVLCTVCDHSTDVPVVREPDHLAQSGRGLHIIDCLSQSWGWTTPTAAGKAVWAALPTAE
ncbi:MULTISPECIES: ATP-binding protein [unclassified Streptomyces]|uniref:ATP-binding protein n=1 Tax=unclassified Streptomyces TaxID=2593676 RepID=UPI00035FE776|nr:MULTISPECIES: ATP-binding protein [unclassified Streptomyces]MYT32561.1 ATP-binding protein [Streptomyces sp. SID8354]